MSEFTPAYAHGTGSAVESARTPRLSDEAERILERRGRFRGRNISSAIARLNMPGEQDTVRRENEVILASLRSRIAERYGASIAERSTRGLQSPPTGQPNHIDRRDVAAGFQHALSTSGGIRGRPEVQAFLPGGDRFTVLSHRFDLTSENAIRNYGRTLVDSLAAGEAPADPGRLDELAALAAQASVEFVVRRAHEFTLDYQALTDELTSDPERRVHLGRFAAQGLFSQDDYANFAKTDIGGAVLVRSRETPVVSHKDKIHLSVNSEDVPKAWEALWPLLLSEDNPFLSWKVIILENSEWLQRMILDGISEREHKGESGFDAEGAREDLYRSSRRMTEGMQFTLYAYTDVDDPGYSSVGASYRHFLTLLDRALADGQVRPGRKPESDVEIGNLSYATYRNEGIGTRGAEFGEAPVTQEMFDELRNTPFYHAMQP